jgi:hypothetical protein
MPVSILPEVSSYKLDISPVLEEPGAVKLVCSECRFFLLQVYVDVRMCPICFPKSWIPFSSIILSYYINLKPEQLIVAEISAFVVLYMKSKNMHTGINRQCPRGLMAAPAIPIDFALDFLASFDVSIVGMPKSPIAPLAAARVTHHNSYYLYLRMVVDKYPNECALMPFKICKLLLEYCESNKAPTVENEMLSFKDQSGFLLYFNDGLFSTSPELKKLPPISVVAVEEEIEVANESINKNTLLDNEAQVARKRPRPAQVVLR